MGFSYQGIASIFSSNDDEPTNCIARITFWHVGSKLNIYERIMAWRNDLPYLEDHDAIFDLV